MAAAGAMRSTGGEHREHLSRPRRERNSAQTRSLPATPPTRADDQSELVAEMQRRRLLASVVDVVARDGLEGATVGAVCRRAGVSRRTFYDLFEDRQACFLAALDSSVGDLTGELTVAWRSCLRWRERVRASLTVLLRRFEQDRALAQLCLVESLKGGPEVLEQRRAALDTLARLIDQGRGEARSGRREPPELTAESVVGGALGVIEGRVLDPGNPSLIALLNPLMSMIVQPYLGAAAARRELEHPTPEDPVAGTDHAARLRPVPVDGDLFEGLTIRITFRTVRVLETIGSHPDASNRDIARAAGMSDQGQASKLLRRLQDAELIQNREKGPVRGEPNAWRLTPRGHTLLNTVGSTH